MSLYELFGRISHKDLSVHGHESFKIAIQHILLLNG